MYSNPTDLRTDLASSLLDGNVPCIWGGITNCEMKQNIAEIAISDSWSRIWRLRSMSMQASLLTQESFMTGLQASLDIAMFNPWNCGSSLEKPSGSSVFVSGLKGETTFGKKYS